MKFHMQFHMKLHTKIQDYFGRNSFRKNLLPAAFAAALLLAPAAAMARPMYAFTDLGDLPGGSDYSAAYGINDHGQVTGISSGYAFVWDRVNGMTSIGTLPPLCCPTSSVGHGINNSGQVVGYSYEANGTGTIDAFLWDRVDGMTDLGAVPGATSVSIATGINDSGQVVGYGGAYNFGSRGFLWDSVTGMTDLGYLSDRNSYTVAHGINDISQVVGYSTAANGFRGFLWQDGVMINLGDLPGGFDYSSATGINNLGQVVGRSEAATGTRAFLWDKDNGMTDLGVLPGDDYRHAQSVALGINDFGQVVGYGNVPNENFHAFLWDADFGMLDLNDLLIESADLHLHEATAINNSGQIVGTATLNGLSRGFLLTPVDAGPQTEVIAPGVLDPGILDAIEKNKITMQPGLFQSFVDPDLTDGEDKFSFTNGVDGFNPANETYVLVHGWNGPDSHITSREMEDVHTWVSAMAGELLVKNPHANILAWNWTKYSDSLARDDLPSLTYIGNLGACQVGTSTNCDIVPVNQVDMQARYLARTFEQLYSGFGDAPGEVTGGVQFLGHSLGAAISANAVNFLSSSAPDVDRLTLFDPPENSAAINIGGKVNLDTVLPGIIRNSPGTVIENYTAEGLLRDPLSPLQGDGEALTGYGRSYDDVANTLLKGYSHSGVFDSKTPMDWYTPTVSQNGDVLVSQQGFIDIGLNRRGLNESGSDIQGRYDQTWANLRSLAPYILSRVGDYVERATEAVLETWHTLKVLGAAAVDGITDGVVYIGEKTITLGEKIGSAISEIAEDVKVEASELGDWLSDGVAKFVSDGLSLFSNSPSYAYRTLHVPDNADSIYFEFMPQVWALDDSYIILFDDDVLYRLDGEFFENAWMDTGFLDVSRWAGRDVQLTIGLLSDEAGHQITTGGFGFTSRVVASVNSVPEPGTLFLLIVGLLGLIGMRLRWVGRVQKWAA